MKNLRQFNLIMYQPDEDLPLACDSTSQNQCDFGIDTAWCSNNAVDLCDIDHAACYSGAFDHCELEDNDGCFNGAIDVCPQPCDPDIWI